MDELVEWRKGENISQKYLAERAGIEKTYLSKIENHKKRATDRLLQRLMNVLRMETTEEEPIDIIIDYCRVRIPTMDIGLVLEKLFHIETDYFLHEDHAFYGYKEQYILGDISVMTSPEEKNGILIELKGRGCRQIEMYLQAQKREWTDFFHDIQNMGGIFKRIDIAINDRFGILDVGRLKEKCKKGECTSYFRGIGTNEEGRFHKQREDNRMEMGETLYIGSKKSEIYFCIYEKDYEQYIRQGVSMAEADVKNRFEIRLKNDRAKSAIEDYLEHGDIGKTAFGIIHHYIRFLEPGKGTKQNWKLDGDWQLFIGLEQRKIKLTMKPEPYTIEKTYNWINKQVMPSLKMLEELDKVKGTTVLQDMMDHTELTEKQKKIIEQETRPIEDVIL